MRTEKITCTVCPIGCKITANIEDGSIAEIFGHGCRRGEAYAKAEIIDPRRTLTTTMRTEGGDLLPVKSAKPIPKGMLFECMDAINKTTAKPPVNIGDVLIEDICKTGVSIVATGRL